MRLKLDENLPVALRAPLEALGFEADTVLDEQLGGHADDAVWMATQAEGRFFVTQDLDFSDVRRFTPGTHAGILLLRVPEHQQFGVADLVIACFSAPEARTWAGCFVVATPSRFRVVRPTPAKGCQRGKRLVLSPPLPHRLRRWARRGDPWPVDGHPALAMHPPQRSHARLVQRDGVGRLLALDAVEGRGLGEQPLVRRHDGGSRPRAPGEGLPRRSILGARAVAWRRS